MIKKYSHLFNQQKFFIYLIILIVLLVYFKSFFHGLVFLDDDSLLYIKFKWLGLDEKISLAFTSNYLGIHYYRPITLLSIITDLLIGGQSFFIYHFTNVILHLLTSILIFVILRKLDIPNFISFLTTLLFALNPIQINAVGWIAGRGDLLAGFFSAAALLIFINFINNNKTYLLILVSFLLVMAILSKETALLLPFLFGGFYFIEKKNYTLNKDAAGILIMIAAVLGFYYLLRGLILSGVYIDKFSFTTYYKNILVLPETVSKFFIPVGIKALPTIEMFTSIAGLIIFFLLLTLPMMLKKINALRYYFGLFWIVFLLLPGMVTRTMMQDGFYYWDCRSYLPIFGFIFIISEFLKTYSSQNGYRYFVLTGFYILILGVVTFHKITLYESPLTYWNSVKADYSSSFLPYIGLFNYYDFNGYSEKAEEQLREAIKIRPEELSIRTQLINSYVKHKLSAKALAMLKNTLIDEKIYSDYLADKYLTMLDESEKTVELNKLFNTYKAYPLIVNKINKIKSELIRKEISHEKL